MPRHRCTVTFRSHKQLLYLILDNFVTDWEIIQTDAQGDDVKTVKLVGCWPTIVGPISMDANAIDTLVEFTVTVEYQWAEVKGVNY